MPNLVKAEFHCHSRYSKDSLVPVDKLRAECLNKGIQRLVVTDHNNIAGALNAHDLDPVLFIIGEEIMTTDGELLGIFVKEPIPGGLPPEETIEVLRSQGAFISVAHPFDTMRSGHWERDNLMKILPQIDAIEVFNSRCIDRQANKIAHEFAQEHQLLVTVGSDSHTLKEVGTSTLRLPLFEDVDSLREALKSAELSTRMSSPWVHFYSSYARWKKKQMINHQAH
jgi:predicted metal-dependent phosphoesterase TrpH